MAELLGDSTIQPTEDVLKSLDTALTGATIPEEVAMPEDVKSSLSYLDKAESALAKLEASNQDMLSGKLPEDVRKQIERQSAESAALRGLGIGKSAGALTARDLGLNSLQLQQQGQQVQASVVSGYQGLSAAREAMRQYNSSFAQSSQQLLAQQQQLRLANVQTGLAYDQYKAGLAMEVNKQIVDLSKFREEVLYNYTAQDKRGDFKDTGISLQTIIDQLSDILGGA